MNPVRTASIDVCTSRLSVSCVVVARVDRTGNVRAGLRPHGHLHVSSRPWHEPPCLPNVALFQQLLLDSPPAHGFLPVRGLALSWRSGLTAIGRRMRSRLTLMLVLVVPPAGSCALPRAPSAAFAFATNRSTSEGCFWTDLPEATPMRSVSGATDGVRPAGLARRNPRTGDCKTSHTHCFTSHGDHPRMGARRAAGPWCRSLGDLTALATGRMGLDCAWDVEPLRTGGGRASSPWCAPG
jgi:hypothetical protein